jgi:hypothetical protein
LRSALTDLQYVRTRSLEQLENNFCCFAGRAYLMAKYASNIVIVLVAALLASVPSQAQRPASVHKIGFVMGGSPDASTGPQVEAFRQDGAGG